MFVQRCSELKTLCEKLKREYSSRKNIYSYTTHEDNLFCLRVGRHVGDHSGIVKVQLSVEKVFCESSNVTFFIKSNTFSSNYKDQRFLHTNSLENLFSNPLKPTSTELEEFELETGYHYFLNENLELVSPETGEVL